MFYTIMYIATWHCLEGSPPEWRHGRLLQNGANYGITEYLGINRDMGLVPTVITNLRKMSRFWRKKAMPCHQWGKPGGQEFSGDCERPVGVGVDNETSVLLLPPLELQSSVTAMYNTMSIHHMTNFHWLVLYIYMCNNFARTIVCFSCTRLCELEHLKNTYPVASLLAAALSVSSSQLLVSP